MTPAVREWCDGANTSGATPRRFYIVRKGEAIGTTVALTKEQAVERWRLLKRDLEDITAQESQEDAR